MCCREPSVAALLQPQKLCVNLSIGLHRLPFYFTSFQLRILLFQSLGRHSTACKAISLRLKKRNSQALAQQGRTPALAGSPCPACREAQIPPRAAQGRRGRGAVFQPPGILLVPGDPSPSPQKGKAVGMELNTPKQAHPRAMRSLTPCAPAGSPHTGGQHRHTGTSRDTAPLLSPTP